ncbi:hypothetical protein FE783_19850 [Paenibacillus mesophilus]|uniref:VOC family protein n=1 Tax=Paenibacillus mesophilus TaxID=2582849 RepID=UPI00110EBB61|nr:VOC family protein [Paenibacillus mesophilus]TMV48198.1 hypothetical protein FE783_19850 [Paenibacillus mesophilus]
MSLLRMKDIYLPVTDLERSIAWFHRIFDVDIEKRQEKTAQINFGNHSGIIVTESIQLNDYAHIPFNLESSNMVKSLSKLIQKGVRVSKSSITDGFHCFDFFDPDGNRIGLVGSEVPGHIDQDENIAVCATFLAVREIDKVIDWYGDTFDLAFRRWTFTGGAGYNSDTYEHDYTIKYAASNFPQWGGIALAETPKMSRLFSRVYTIQASDACELYRKLQAKGVQVSKLQENSDNIFFEFTDIEGNRVGIIEVLSHCPSVDGTA